MATNRSVYIGGLLNGKRTAQNVGEALGTEDAFTLSYAMNNPREIARAVRGAKLYTHSGGLLAAEDTSPAEINAIAAPLPKSATSLVARTVGVKIPRMAGHSLSSREAFRTVNSYNASAIAETARHPVGNLKHLRAISKTDSVQLAHNAQESGIPTWLFYMDADDYKFIPNDEQRTFAKVLGIELHMLEGRHDQLPLYPAETLAEIDRIKQNAISS